MALISVAINGQQVVSHSFNGLVVDGYFGLYTIGRSATIWLPS